MKSVKTRSAVRDEYTSAEPFMFAGAFFGDRKRRLGPRYRQESATAGAFTGEALTSESGNVSGDAFQHGTGLVKLSKTAAELTWVVKTNARRPSTGRAGPRRFGGAVTAQFVGFESPEAHAFARRKVDPHVDGRQLHTDAWVLLEKRARAAGVDNNDARCARNLGDKASSRPNEAVVITGMEQR